MIFCVVTDGGAAEVETLPECDIALFGFQGLGEVDYEKELKCETEKFEVAVQLSKKCSCGVLCGCITDSRGLLRKSVAVSDRGKLLGISDMHYVLDCEDFKGGSALGFYNVNGCKIGLCIENDLLFPDAIHSLSMCGCNAVFAVMREVKDNIPQILCRAYAYLYGIPVIMCAGKTAYFADITGAIATSTQKYALFEVSPQNKYHLVTTRQKGKTSDERADY